jgi:hypothetical protein
MEGLQSKFKSEEKSGNFVVWLNNLWNRLKAFINRKVGKDIVQIISDDLLLRRDPYKRVTSPSSLAYQLGQRARVKDPLNTFTASLGNTFALKEKYRALQEKDNVDGNKAKRDVLNSLYNRYVAETLNQVPGQKKLFNGKTYGLTAEQLQDDRKRTEKVVEFAKALNEMNPSIWAETEQVVGSILTSVQEEEFDPEAIEDGSENPNKVEIKGTKQVSASVRTILRSLINDATNDPYSPDFVMRSVLAINENTYTAQGFSRELDRRAKKDPVAAQLKFVLDALGPEYKNPIIRELSSLEQIESTSIIIDKDPNGNIIFKKKIQNEDYQQEEEVKSLANHLLTVVKQGKIDGIIKALSVSKNTNLTIQDQAIKKAILETFGIEDFNMAKYEEMTGNGYGYIYKMFDQVIKEKIDSQSSTTDVLKEMKAFMKSINSYAQEMTPLQSNFINTMGNRVPSIFLGSWFTETRKVLNSPTYVKRLMKTELYKNNPVVQAVNKGMKMKTSKHDAVSNIVNRRKNEYSKQSTIDNKVNGFLRFVHSSITNSPYYDQHIGVTADRSYQTYFTVQKQNMIDPGTNNLTKEGVKLLQESAKRDQLVIDSIKDDWQNLDKGQMENFLKALNALTLHNVVLENGQIKVKPVLSKDQMNRYRQDIAELVKDLNTIGIDKFLEEQIQEKRPEESINFLAANYFFNDYINRKSLEDLFAGPLERHIIKTKLEGKSVKDITEAIKRMGLANSVGVKNELDQPVLMVVVDTKNENGDAISDSFSQNGSYLMDALKKLGGILDKVGTTIKDSYYHVDHADNGRVVSMKMSTLGLQRTLDDQGNYIGHNFEQYTPENHKGNISHKKIGDAIIGLENYMAEQDEFTNTPYVKVVDSDVIKNEMPPGARVIKMSDLIAMSEKGDYQSIIDASSNMPFLNYRTVFNLDKDISQIPLSEQKVKLASQVSLLALNHADKDTVAKIEDLMVNQLRKQLRAINYDPKNKSKNKLTNIDQLIDLVLLNEEETQTDYTKEVFQTIRDFNNKSQIYRALQDMKENKAIETTNDYINSLKENNKLKRNPEKDVLLSELESGNKTVEQLLKVYKPYKHSIKSLDHSNIKFAVEQAVTSVINKKGININVAGNYLRVIPDSNEDLKYSDPESGRIAEIAVPWSMFGNTRKEAQDKLEAANMQAGGRGLQTLAVRIPTSGETMVFAARVKYFLDGTSNNVAVPTEFIKISDSDHDADKLFVYRMDMNDDGSPKLSLETQIFEEYFKVASSKQFIEATHKQDVKVENLVKRSKEILRTLIKSQPKNENKSDQQIEEMLERADRSLRTLQDVSEFANSMKDGLDAVGIFAVAVKTISGLSQSGITLKEPITIDLGGTYMIDGVATSKYTINAINKDSINDTALFLQAALDNAKEMALGFTGVNKDNIGTVSTMLALGMKVEHITALINNPEVTSYLNDINADSSLYSMNEAQDKEKQRTGYQFKEKTAVLEKNTKLLNAEENLKFFNATKAEALDQEVNTNLPDGIYTNTIKYNKNNTAFYKLDTVDGKKRVSRIKYTQAYHNIIGQESDVLNSYFMLEDISKELTALNPLLQLDAGLKTTGHENYAIEEGFKKISNKEKLKFFDYSAFIERSKYNHYMEMNALQRAVEEALFLTENKNVYDAAANVASNTLDGYKNKTQAKMLMDETIQTTYAQDMLPQTVKDMNKAELDKYVENSAASFKTIYEFVNNISTDVKNRELIEKLISEGQPMPNPSMQAAYDKMVQIDGLMAMYNQEINTNQGKMTLKNFLKANPFIQHLEIQETTKGLKIVPKRIFKNYSPAEKQRVQQSFNSLMEYAPNIANDLLAYQLLHNGLDQKIGSYAELMPENVLIKYLNLLSEKAAFSEGVSKVQSVAYQINTALRMVNQFPDISQAQEISKEEAEQKKSNRDPYQIDFYQKDGKLYVRDSEFNLIPADKFGSFMTNGNYYRYGTIKDFTKLYLNKETVTKEEVEQVKKCFK